MVLTFKIAENKELPFSFVSDVNTQNSKGALFHLQMVEKHDMVQRNFVLYSRAQEIPAS